MSAQKESCFRGRGIIRDSFGDQSGQILRVNIAGLAGLMVVLTLISTRFRPRSTTAFLSSAEQL